MLSFLLFTFILSEEIKRSEEELMKRWKANILLLLAALIWGCAFCAQSVGMDYLGPFTFNGTRFIIGGLVLLPVIAFLRKSGKNNFNHNKEYYKRLLLSGIACGLCLAVASTVQQVGIIYTSAGKAGFITALYVILVPLFGLFLGHKPGFLVWIGVVLAVGGMYLLCVSGVDTINKGDILIFICAVCFTFHILIVDRLAPKVDGVELSCVQFFTAGILCSVLVPFTGEVVSAEGFLGAMVPLLYTGIFSSGVAYTLQIIGQKHTSPTLASLLLSLESVFAALSAWVILGNKMSTREILGALLCFSAIVLAQLPTKVAKPVNS